MKFDDLDQEGLLDSLVFHGVKQLSGVDLRALVLHTLNQKMSLPEITASQVTNVTRLRHTGTDREFSTRVATIIVKFSSRDIARGVYKAKSLLASSRAFVAECLTKRRRDILNAAKESLVSEMHGLTVVKYW